VKKRQASQKYAQNFSKSFPRHFKVANFFLKIVKRLVDSKPVFIGTNLQYLFRRPGGDFSEEKKNSG
jgi:hypothetical protein